MTVATARSSFSAMRSSSELDAGTAAFMISVLRVPGDLHDDRASETLATDQHRHEEGFRAFYDVVWRTPAPDLPAAVTEALSSERPCLGCNTPISDRAANAPYCSGTCRQASYRLRQRKGIEDHGDHAAGC